MGVPEFSEVFAFQAASGMFLNLTQSDQSTSSLAVEGFDPEEIGMEVILVSKEADFFVEQHIQNPPKSAVGKSH